METQENCQVDQEEFENVANDPRIFEVQQQLKLKIDQFISDLERIKFISALIKERRKEFKDLIFTERDEKFVEDEIHETEEKLEAARQRKKQFDDLIETKVKPLEFAINQRRIDLHCIEKHTKDLFDRFPHLAEHFYNTQDRLEDEADAVRDALDIWLNNNQRENQSDQENP